MGIFRCNGHDFKVPRGHSLLLGIYSTTSVLTGLKMYLLPCVITSAPMSLLPSLENNASTVITSTHRTCVCLYRAVKNAATAKADGFLDLNCLSACNDQPQPQPVDALLEQPPRSLPCRLSTGSCGV